jgi:hypothetical protein
MIPHIRTSKKGKVFWAGKDDGFIIKYGPINQQWFVLWHSVFLKMWPTKKLAEEHIADIRKRAYTNAQTHRRLGRA